MEKGSDPINKSKSGRYSEEDEIGNVTWSYSVNKMACEKSLEELSDQCGFHWTIVRPYITYGKTRIPLQFGPLEYYTIINRAKANKIIPICEGDIKCTLTYSKDFAVGIVGLIGNSSAYNECYNIVGDYETSWNDVHKMTFTGFGMEYEVVELENELFRKKQLMRGLNAEEVTGDKGRDMLFDNYKIKSAVPSFSGRTAYSEIVPEIVDYFENPENQVINYAWDARVDNMLSKSDRLTSEQKKQLKYAPGHNATFINRLTYLFNRYDITFYIYRAFHKVLQSVK